jgi:hypothetical protein
VPSETFNHPTLTTADRLDVWDVLQKPEIWEGISGVDEVRDPIVDHNGSLRGFSFKSIVAGKTYIGTAVPSLREEGRIMGWDIETSDIAGTVTVGLTDADGGTMVDVTLLVSSRGTLSGVFFPLISSTIGGGFQATVEDFASRLS